MCAVPLVNRLRPLLVGFMLITLMTVQALAMYRVAQHAFHIHKCYNHHDVLAQFAERLTLDGPPAVTYVPVVVQAYGQPLAFAPLPFEGLAIVAALPRAPPAFA
jgi:hypothetical protein